MAVDPATQRVWLAGIKFVDGIGGVFNSTEVVVMMYNSPLSNSAVLVPGR